MSSGGLLGKLDKMLDITCAGLASLAVCFILQKPELSLEFLDPYSWVITLSFEFSLSCKIVTQRFFSTGPNQRTMTRSKFPCPVPSFSHGIIPVAKYLYRPANHEMQDQTETETCSLPSVDTLPLPHPTPPGKPCPSHPIPIHSTQRLPTGCLLSSLKSVNGVQLMKNTGKRARAELQTPIVESYLKLTSCRLATSGIEYCGLSQTRNQKMVKNILFLKPILFQQLLPLQCLTQCFCCFTHSNRVYVHSPQWKLK